MKIGILTMHAVPNYGSFLQAYSLKRQMEQRGADRFRGRVLTGNDGKFPSL